jgi:hypothetical protein
MAIHVKRTDAQEEQEGFDKEVYGVTHRQLDALDEKSVRYSLAKGEYGAPGSASHEIVLSWIASKEAELRHESISIARKALLNSRIAIAFSTIIAIAIAFINHFAK